MRAGDLAYFKKYYFMSPSQFGDYILNLVNEDLERETFIREPISSAERLDMTLRYLCSGALMQDIALSFRLGISEPKTETWLHIVEGFSRTWQFLNCIGAVDGKHIHIKCPPNSGSMYFNYKGTYSIVLLAVVDSDYKFVIVDVGAYGKQSDGGVLKQSKFGCRLENGKLHIPRDLELPNTSHPAPCVFVGDEAFQLRTEFLWPYPGRGLKGQRRSGHWRELLAQPPMQVARTQARHFAKAARQVRNLYATHFFSKVGKVPWQDKILFPVNTGPNAALPVSQ
nr:protein ALP1-like [Rhipicephalus microplus]